VKLVDITRSKEARLTIERHFLHGKRDVSQHVSV